MVAAVDVMSVKPWMGMECEHEHELLTTRKHSGEWEINGPLARHFTLLIPRSSECAQRSLPRSTEICAPQTAVYWRLFQPYSLLASVAMSTLSHGSQCRSH